MRIFNEYLPSPVEYAHTNISTSNRTVFLEDIISDPTTDIIISYQKQVTKIISSDFPDIYFDGIVASTSINYFYENNHEGLVSNYYNIPGNRMNIIKILVTDIQSDSITAEIYVNNTLADTITKTDAYGLVNYQSMLIDSTVLGTSIVFVNPVHLSIGEYVEIKQYYINIVASTDINISQYVCAYDELTNNLLFDRDYVEELNYVVQSRGNMVRSSTINELRRLQENSLLILDESSDTISIPQRFIYPEGKILKIIEPQQLILDPLEIQVNYTLIGIYLHDDNQIYKNELLNTDTYLDMISQLSYFTLDEEKRYLMYLIVFNGLSSLTYTDVFNLGGLGGGGGGGGVSKLLWDVTNQMTIDINYQGGTTPPMVQFLDDQGIKIMPQEISYNYSDTIHINFGEIFSGQVIII